MHARKAVLQVGQTEIESHLHLLPLVQHLLKGQSEAVQQVSHWLPYSSDMKVVQPQLFLRGRTLCLLALFHFIIG